MKITIKITRDPALVQKSDGPQEIRRGDELCYVLRNLSERMYRTGCKVDEHIDLRDSYGTVIGELRIEP